MHIPIETLSDLFKAICFPLQNVLAGDMANVTIDDADPSVVYIPETAWNARSASVPCSTWIANPNANLLFDNTFHDGTVRLLLQKCF